MKAKYYIYKNLHRKCFSIRYKGIVIDHAWSIYVENVKFKVNEAGRQRVIKTGQKNVHAFIVADTYISEPDDQLLKDVLKNGYHGIVYYNPFKQEVFSRGTDYDNNPIPIFEAKKILICDPSPILIEL